MGALFVIFGAVLRWWDGTRGDIGTVHVPGGVRSAMLAGACLLAAGWSFGFGIGTGIPWTGLWAAAVAGYSIVTGRTDWPRWWMTLRFGLPALVAVLPAAVVDGPAIGQAAYVLACAAAGGMYPLLFWLHRTGRWRRWSPLDGPESWCRIPLGGFVIGGLAWI